MRWIAKQKGKRIFVFLFFLMAFSVHARVLRVGVYQNPPKIGYEQNTPYGFYIDLVKYFAEQEGWELKYVLGSWDECFQKLRTGEIDLLPDVTYSEEREAFLDFNKYPILSYWVEIFHRRNMGVEEFEDLDGRRLGVLKGSYQEDFIRQRIEAVGLDAEIVSLSSYAEIHQFLQEGLIDAGTLERYSSYLDDFTYLDETPLVIDLMTVHFAARENRLSEVLKSIDLYMGEAFNDSDSFYFQAVNRWLDDRSAYRVPSLILIVLGVIAVAALLFFIIVLVFRIRLKQKTKELRLRNVELKKAKTALDQEHSELKAVVEEREVLVRELFHRIGNNMSTISSFVSLKGLNVKSDEARQLCDDFYFFVLSQSLVHQQLYLSGNLSEIPLDDYLRQLIRCSCKKWGSCLGFDLQLEAEAIPVVIDFALPFGMVIIELLQNARKHIFRREQVTVSLVLREVETSIYLEYRDNGPGLPENAFSRGGGLGLVKQLIEDQLQGELTLWNEGGLHIKMILPTDHYQKRI